MSIDFKGNPHSSIVDAQYTKVMDGIVKVLSLVRQRVGLLVATAELRRKLRVQSAPSSAGA